jgi:hypothetical protein
MEAFHKRVASSGEVVSVVRPCRAYWLSVHGSVAGSLLVDGDLLEPGDFLQSLPGLRHGLGDFNDVEVPSAQVIGCTWRVVARLASAFSGVVQGASTYSRCRRPPSPSLVNDDDCA